MHVVARDILEERMQVDFLLKRAAKRRAHRLSDNGEHRLMVELRIVEAVQEMNCSGARGGEANAHLVRELGVRGRHEGGFLLVPNLHELKAIQGAVERAQNAVDAVTGIAVDPPYAPLRKARKHEIGDGLCHGGVFISVRRLSVETPIRRPNAPTEQVARVEIN